MGSLLVKANLTATPGQPMVAISPDTAGWRHISFRSYRMPPGTVMQGDTEVRETALIVLGGICTMKAGDQVWDQVGRRANVWERIPPCTLLLPPNTPFNVTSQTDVHLAVAAAPAPEGRAIPPRLITPEQVAKETRGEGNTSRFIHHLLPDCEPAASLLLTEVYTPAGNWSSFPPHKHDSEEPPRESYLEEIYYYQLNPIEGFAFQRIYTPDRDLDQVLAPDHGDVVLVPRGYHPVAVPPGCECYYLNVMAGYNRAWNFRVEPTFASQMNWTKPQTPQTESGSRARRRREESSPERPYGKSQDSA